jgi:hypothetical protein
MLTPACLATSIMVAFFVKRFRAFTTLFLAAMIMGQDNISFTSRNQKEYSFDNCLKTR